MKKKKKKIFIINLPPFFVFKDRGPKKKIKDFEPWLTLMSQPKYPGERSDEHKVRTPIPIPEPTKETQSKKKNKK